MFHRLHKLAKLLVWMFVLGVFAFVWQQRAVFEPVLVWYEVMRNGGLENDDELPMIQGKAVAISDGHTLRLRTAEGSYYVVRLAGLEYPNRPLTVVENELERKRREAMRELVLSNWVHVEVAYAANHSVLGIVHNGQLNLNLHLITNGLASMNPEYIRRMPRLHQYRFFSAARAGKKWNVAVNSKLQ